MSSSGQNYCLEDICGGEYGIFATVDICCNKVDEFTFIIDSNQPGFPRSIDVGPQDIETSEAIGNCSAISYYNLGCYDPSFTYQVTALDPVLNQSNITYHDFFLFHAHLYDIEPFEDECDILAADLDKDEQITFNDYILGYFPFLYLMEDLQFPWFWDYSDLLKNDSLIIIRMLGGEMGEIDCIKDQIWEFVGKEKCDSMERETCFSSFEFHYYDETYTFCLGDTVMINNLFELANQVYTVELHGIDFPSIGIELSTNSDTIYRVLDEVEEGCICLEYRVPNLSNVLDVDMYVCKLVNVVDRTKLNIETTNSKSSSFTLCQGEPLELYDLRVESSSPEWHLSNGETYTSDTINISFADPGEYSVILSDNSNCDCFESDTLMITVIAEAKEWVDLSVCAGNMISYEGQDYSEDDLDTLHLQTTMGCDSLVYVSVTAYDEIEIEFQLSPTCSEADVGSITIISSNQSSVSYILDNNSIDSSSISTGTLSAGPHTLEVVDLNNCSRVFDFEILELPAPSLQLNTFQTCLADSTGGLMVDNSTTYPLKTSLDLESLNTYVDLFEGLKAGEYTLYVEDTLGCVFEYPFEIDSYTSPTIEIEPMDSCYDLANGGLVISVLSGNPRFSLDVAQDFTNDLEIGQLASGQYMLYILSEFDCLDSLLFTINELPLPELTIGTEAACVSEDNGVLILDGIDLFDSLYIDDVATPLVGVIEDFPAGVHTILAIDKNGCQFSEEFIIESSPNLDVMWPEILVDCVTSQVLITPHITNTAGEIEYIWSNGSTSSEILVANSGVYAVTITDLCTEISYSWELDFITNSNEDSFFTPNIFMPNGISPNNCFNSRASSKVSVINSHLRIFDPWGNLIFETRESLDCWDGMFDNQFVQSGVYIYVNRITYLECEVEKQIEKVGDVTVVY